MNLSQRFANPVSVAGFLAVAFFTLSSAVMAEEKAPVKIDFENYEVGAEPDDLFIIEGTFKIADDSGDKVLQLEPLPLSESGVIFGKSLKGAASVSVDVKATKRRRSTPRMGVGLHGISGYRLRLVPATGVIELVKAEEVVKSSKIKWASGEWFTMKLSIEVGKDGKWNISGWVWPKGSDAPEAPAITMESDERPGQGKASVWGTPYSGTPIFYDDIQIQDLAKEKS